jgi:hypothetical protein
MIDFSLRRQNHDDHGLRTGQALRRYGVASIYGGLTQGEAVILKM